MEVTKIIIYTVGILLFIALSFGLWKVGKVINYNLNYQDMVIQTIHEQVRKECLK